MQIIDGKAVASKTRDNIREDVARLVEKTGKQIGLAVILVGDDPASQVYVRNKNKRSDYLVLVSTDLTLSEEEIIQTYGKRWNIEVFFKMCKSYLKLGKETRSISYDALTAHTAIIFARYMMLALEQRRNMDERSLGELFYLTIDELEDLHYLDALASLLSLLMDCAKEAEILDEEQVNQLLDLFVAKLPDLWGKCLKQCA